MTRLESGPARTDRNYWLVVGLAFLIFAAWFVKDGAYGYRDKNREQAANDLLRWTDPPPDGQGFELGEEPTEKDFEDLMAANPTTREEVYEKLGRPLPPRRGTASSDGMERFASIYGMATVPIDATGRVDARRMQWQKWAKTKEQIRAQFLWALVPGLAAVYFFFRAFKAARLRAVIDEEGMTYGGTRVAFAEMVSLRDYNRKGWVDLYYRVGDGEKRLRIDNQKIAKFDEIAELICEKKGFANPLKAAAEPDQPEAEAQEAGAEVEGTPDESRDDQA